LQYVVDIVSIGRDFHYKHIKFNLVYCVEARIGVLGVDGVLELVELTTVEDLCATTLLLQHSAEKVSCDVTVASM